MTSPFQNKKTLVAGGSSGIGLTTALQFANHQASVIVTGRNPEKLKQAEDYGLQAAMLDSTSRPALDAFFQNFGTFDHLVISLSGSKGAGNFADLSLDVLKQGFEEKYWAILNTMQAALPFINNGGSITLVTAISASAKMPGTSGLGAINGALEIMVPILAKELPCIRINTVSPGVINTAWWDFLPQEAKTATFNQFAAQIPAGRVGKAEEIADVILFLAGNSYMTGKVVGCDGGMS